MNKKINLRNGHGDIIYPNVIDKNNKDILDTVQNNSINIQELEKQLLHDGNKIDAIISSINDLKEGIIMDKDFIFKIQPGYKLVNAGETFNIIINCNIEKPKIEWFSNNKEVATVTEDGEVKAISEGTATITATTLDNLYTSSIIVDVVDENKPVNNGLFTHYNIFGTTDVEYIRKNGIKDLTDNRFDLLPYGNKNTVTLIKNGLKFNDSDFYLRRKDFRHTFAKCTLEFVVKPNYIKIGESEDRVFGIGGSNGTGLSVQISRNKITIYRNSVLICDNIPLTTDLRPGIISYITITSSYDRIVCYVNGSVVKQILGNFNDDGIVFDDLIIANNGNHMNQTFYSAKIYDRILRPEEIKHNYSYEKKFKR